MANVMDLRGKIREANLGDLESLKQLDDACFEYPWSKPDFAEALGSRGAQVVLVVEHEKRLIAYAVYVRLPKRAMCQILRMGVLAEFRRKRVASQLMASIRQELDARTTFRVCAQDNDLISHQFLKTNGLTCSQILPKYYRFADNTTGDAYEFVFGGAAFKPKPRVYPNAGRLEVNLKNRFGNRKGFTEDDCV